MFPKVEVHAIDEDKLKSEKSKKLWRTFCGEYNDERVKVSTKIILYPPSHQT
jgi:hypothetical protein